MGKSPHIVSRVTSPRVPSVAQRDTQLEEWEEVLPSPPMLSLPDSLSSKRNLTAGGVLSLHLNLNSESNFTETTIGFQPSPLEDFIFAGQTVRRLLVNRSVCTWFVFLFFFLSLHALSRCVFVRGIHVLRKGTRFLSLSVRSASIPKKLYRHFTLWDGETEKWWMWLSSAHI